MNVEQICWLRERLELVPGGGDRVMVEFSCDPGTGRTPHFFRVQETDLAHARSLYREWGGVRANGYRIGTTVRGPGIPAAQSIRIWRQNGNH